VAEDSSPFLRVVRGDATDEEIAALVAALATVSAARQAGDGDESPRLVREWNNRSRLVRSAVFPSVGGWRRSALPR
jgi:hypothetical protein